MECTIFTSYLRCMLSMEFTIVDINLHPLAEVAFVRFLHWEINPLSPPPPPTSSMLHSLEGSHYAQPTLKEGTSWRAQSLLDGQFLYSSFLLFLAVLPLSEMLK